MPHHTKTDRRIHPANAILCAVGCIGIGTMLGGWVAEQPAMHNNPDASRGQVAGIAIDARDNYLYRTFTNGRVERLLLGQGVTRSGTTAGWQLFKEP